MGKDACCWRQSGPNGVAKRWRNGISRQSHFHPQSGFTCEVQCSLQCSCYDPCRKEVLLLSAQHRMLVGCKVRRNHLDDSRQTQKFIRSATLRSPGKSILLMPQSVSTSACCWLMSRSIDERSAHEFRGGTLVIDLVWGKVCLVDAPFILSCELLEGSCCNWQARQARSDRTSLVSCIVDRNEDLPMLFGWLF